MSTSWLWLNIFQSGSRLLCYQTSHHTILAMFFYNGSWVGLGLVLSALLIKDQNSKENSKTYLTMLSLTITILQGIIPKLIALQRRRFRHVGKDFERFAPLRAKRIRTWPSLTSSWVIGCPNMPLCFISLLTFYFWGDIPFHLLSLLLKWTRLWTWTFQPLGAKVIAEKAALFRRVMPVAMEKLYIAQHWDTLPYAHMRRWL